MGLFKTTNYYTHKGGKEYVPYEKDVTIHEHRAPTDESVRLLNEFEEKARKNIIHKISVNENNLNAVSIIFKK